MYNYDYNITYNHVPTNKQNDEYQKNILECFNIKKYNFEIIGKIQDEIFDANKNNNDFMKLINIFQNNQTVIPVKLPLRNCFVLLFQFEYFYLLHKCLKDLHKQNKIKEENFENITFLIKKYN